MPVVGFLSGAYEEMKRGFDRLPCILNVSSERDIDAAFASFARQRVNAVMVGADAFFTSRRDQLVELAARHAIPASYHIREFVAAGGLMSYGANLIDMYRHAGSPDGRTAAAVAAAGARSCCTITSGPPGF
jgi:hypothetical protein